MSSLNNITTQIDSIKTDIVTSHTNLKNALTEKGVEVLPTDKMSSLIAKIPNIALGKKWASGVFTTTKYNQVIEIRGLSFKPNFFICRDIKTPAYPEYNIISNLVEFKSVWTNTNSANNTTSLSEFLDDGVKTRITANGEYTWIAFE